jgi:hypothetical protein
LRSFPAIVEMAGSTGRLFSNAPHGGDMKRIPNVIPPRSRVRLVRADRSTLGWRNDVGRQFRVGYYAAKTGWIVFGL